MSHDDSRYDIYVYIYISRIYLTECKSYQSQIFATTEAKILVSSLFERTIRSVALTLDHLQRSSVENLRNRPSNFAIFQISVLEVYVYDVVGRRIARAASRFKFQSLGRTI